MSAGYTAINYQYFDSTHSTSAFAFYKCWWDEILKKDRKILRILGKTIFHSSVNGYVPVVFFHTGSKSLIAHRFVFDDRSLVEIQGYGCLGNPLTYLPHCLDVTKRYPSLWLAVTSIAHVKVEETLTLHCQRLFPLSCLSMISMSCKSLPVWPNFSFFYCWSHCNLLILRPYERLNINDWMLLWWYVIRLINI